MEQGLTFLARHVRVGITQNESDRGEEIRLARAVAAHDNIVLRGKSIDERLLLV